MLKGYQRLANNLVGLVNSRERVDRKTRDALAPKRLRESVLATARQAHESGLVAGSLGEVSLRLSGSRMLFASAGTLFSQIEDKHLAIASISTERTSVNKQFPLHLSYHQAAYQNTEAQAVLFSQPAAVLALLAREITLQPELMTDAPGVTGAVSLLTAHEGISEKVRTHGALLIEAKGLLTWGRSLEQALDKAEIIQRWCQVSLLAAVE